MDGTKIILNDNIKTLFNRQLHPIVNLTHTLEEQINALKNFNVEVEIADNTFKRKIQSFNPIDNSIIVDVPFPFMSTNNSTDELSCKITVTSSSSDKIICNGNFLSKNNFYYENKKNKFLYNVSENSILPVTISNDGQELILPESNANNTNQQHMLIYSDSSPSNLWKINSTTKSKILFISIWIYLYFKYRA